MRKNPVLVLFGGLAGVIIAILGCFVVGGALAADLAAAIGVAVTSACALAGAVTRAIVDSPDTVHAKVLEAYRRPQLVPATPEEAQRAVDDVTMAVEARKAA